MCIIWFLNDHVTLSTAVMAAENVALHHRNKLHFKMYLKQKTNLLNIIFEINMSQYYCFYSMFDQIGLNGALLSIRGIFQKHHKIWWPQIFEQ